MVIVGLAIIVVWGTLLGAAYLARVRAHLDRRSAMAIVTACYLGLSALALLWLGWTWQGGAGVTGMLLPYAAAAGCVLVARRGP